MAEAKVKPAIGGSHPCDWSDPRNFVFDGILDGKDPPCASAH